MRGERHDLVVVGGGISGLGFAHMAQRTGIEPLLLESSEQVGGCLCSHTFSTPTGSYWAELGAHTCYNSYGNLLSILEELGQLEQLQPKTKLPFRLLTPSGLRKIPSQLNIIELLTSLPKLFTLKKDGLTVDEYFGSIIGRRNFAKVLGPALDAVICQPSAQVMADTLFRKKPRRKEIIRSFSGRSGVQQFSDAIAANSAVEVRTNSSVVTLQPLDDGFILRLADGSEIEARQVALAVAPDLAAEIMRTSYQQISDLIQPIEMVDIESLAIVVEADQIKLEPLAGIIAVDDDFYSVVSRDPISDERYRGFTFHFKPGRLSADEQLERACRVLGVREGQVTAAKSHNNRLPSLRSGHRQRIEKLDGMLASTPQLAMTGNWFAGVSIEDCLVRSAAEAARLVRR
jgi:protoporphyrinogen oxidase